MNSIYTAEKIELLKKIFIEEGDDLQAMMEAAKQSVETLNRDFANSNLQFYAPGIGGDGYFIGIGLSELNKRVRFIDVLPRKETSLCEHGLKRQNI